MKLSIINLLSFLFIIFQPLFSNDKPSIAVLDFEALEMSQGEVEILSRRITSLLVKSNKYLVTDRNNMKSILMEQSFQMSGCTSSECIIEVGGFY